MSGRPGVVKIEDEASESEEPPRSTAAAEVGDDTAALSGGGPCVRRSSPTGLAIGEPPPDSAIAVGRGPSSCT